MSRSTPATQARNRQEYSAQLRVHVGLEVGHWPQLRRELYVRVGVLELLRFEVSDVGRKQAQATLARLGLPDDDLLFLSRAVEALV